MERKSVVEVKPLNPGESKNLKAQIFDLSESGAKQALYGLVQVLSCRPSVGRIMFESVIDDARKYCEVKGSGK
jgi:hypothetical protein